MADNKYKDFTDDAILELKRLEKEQKRIESDKQKYEKAGHDKRLKQYKDYKVRLQEIKELTEEITEDEEKRLKYNKALTKETINFARSVSKLDKDTRRLLGLDKSRGKLQGAFASLGTEVVKMKAQEVNLEGDKLEESNRIRDIIEERMRSEESQAKAAAKAGKEETELTRLAKEKLYYESLRAKLGDKITDNLIDSVNMQEKSYRFEQRTLQLKEQQKNLYDSIPQSIKSSVDFGKGLVNAMKNAGAAVAGIAILGTILVSSIMMFTELDSQAESFRKNTGIAVSQMRDLNSQANRLVGEFREIGLQAEDFFGIQEQLVGVLGDTVRVSDEVAGVQAIITKNFGATNENAAKSLQIFQSLGGVSTETAANLQLQTAELAKQAGVAPAKIFEDIANSSDNIYGLFRGNTEELVKQAVEARRLGTNLSDVVAVTEKLLDFESSITSELEASAFVGGQFNLTRARSLAAAGEEVEAQKEILRQIQRSGDFRQQDLFTQRALAAAAGMSVAEINRQLTVQERLNSLSADQREAAERAIEQGLDISQINEGQLNQEVQRFKLQKEQQGQVANLSNAFQGIAATLASSLVPLIESLTPLLSFALEPIKIMAEGLKFIVDTATEYKEITLALVGVLGSVLAIQKGIVLYQRRAAVLRLLNIKREAALASIKALSNPAVALAGIAAAGLVTGLAVKYMSTADDMVSPGYGKRALFDEGSVTLLNNNDTVVAGTNLQGNQNMVSSNNNSDLIRELKGLRQEFSKNRDTYIDGTKVTSRIGRVVNESTRNNFSLA
jgi:hypothetical protein